jgi:hypothetical protein
MTAGEGQSGAARAHGSGDEILLDQWLGASRPRAVGAQPVGDEAWRSG